MLKLNGVVKPGWVSGVTQNELLPWKEPDSADGCGFGDGVLAGPTCVTKDYFTK